MTTTPTGVAPKPCATFWEAPVPVWTVDRNTFPLEGLKPNRLGMSNRLFSTSSIEVPQLSLQNFQLLFAANTTLLIQLTSTHNFTLVILNRRWVYVPNVRRRKPTHHRAQHKE